MASLKIVCWVCIVFGAVVLSVAEARVPAKMEILTGNSTTEVTTHNITNSTESMTTATTTNVTVVTTEANNVTVANATTEPPTTQANNTMNPNATTEVTTVNGTTTNVTIPVTSNVTTVTTEPMPTSHGQSTPNTSPQTTTPKSSKSRFDVASFFGGVATAVGLAIIVFIGVCCYNKNRKNSYHAMN